MVVTYNTYANLNENKNKQKKWVRKKGKCAIWRGKVPGNKARAKVCAGKKKKKTALAKISPIRKKTGLLWNKEMTALR